jgi:hypothetical protein
MANVFSPPKGVGSGNPAKLSMEERGEREGQRGCEEEFLFAQENLPSCGLGVCLYVFAFHLKLDIVTF